MLAFVKCKAIMLLIMMMPSLCFAEEINIDKMVKAIYLAEGGSHAKKPFGVLSVKCESYRACERVCRNTVRNNIRRWKEAGEPSDFISFLGARYAPVQCSPLNRNWVPNVRRLYAKGN